MIPSTVMSLGTSRQQNIGLDKENFTGILSYNWIPKRNRTAKLDLFNIQYIRNVNPDKYFKVYKSSYGRLNDIAQLYPAVPDSYLNDKGNLDIDNGGADNFINRCKESGI